MHRDFFCNKCSLQFGKKYVFDLHLSLVHGEKIKVKSEPQDCKENSQEFQTPEKNCSDLEVVTSLKCDMCDSFFKDKRDLKKHVESVHEQKKQFHCNICDAYLTTKQSLNGHIATIHKGKKPFKCNICDASFTQKRNLNGHIASVHEGKKPFKCPTCDARFAQKSNLKKHLTSVHKEKL